jgi:hypothetical protein
MKIVDWPQIHKRLRSLDVFAGCGGMSYRWIFMYLNMNMRMSISIRLLKSTIYNYAPLNSYRII